MFDWKNVPAGHYTLTARATDTLGLISASPSILVTVNPGSIAVAAPDISPAGGIISGPTAVTLTTTTPGANITYTLDGTEPTASSTIYAGPFLLAKSGPLKAKAFLDGAADSAVTSANFVLLAAPLINLEVGSASAGEFRFRVSGIVGQQFVIETSTNLIEWNGISTNTLTSPVMEIIDVTSPESKTLFYRASLTSQ